MKVSDITNPPPKILLVGNIGTGKTALTLTLGEGLEIADLDNGLKTGNSLKDKFTDARKAVSVRQFLEPDGSSLGTVFPAFAKYVREIPARIRSGDWKFKAFAVDSLSSLAEAALAYVMKNSGKVGGNPEIQHWGITFNEIKNVLNVLRYLPVPVVLIAHEQVKTVGKGEQKRDILEVAVSGKNLASQICRYYDEIWYVEPRATAGGKQTFVLKTISDSIFPARSRSCLENGINTEIGMWELLKKIGYEPPKENK